MYNAVGAPDSPGEARAVSLEASAGGAEPGGSPWRTLAAGLVGFGCAVLIWVIAPYLNEYICTSLVSDDYFPVAAVFLLMVIVLGFNPLLRAIRPALALTTRQLAIVLAVMLVACVIPGQGLMRMLPYMIARAPMEVSENKPLAAQYKRLDLPPELFPDKMAFQSRPTVAEQFNDQLRPGAAVPWRAWAGPLVSWGAFLAAGWVMMLGLSQIVLPQWRRNERLAFPLVSIQQSLIESPPPGGLVAPLFGRRSFWAAAAAVFAIYLLFGANIYYPESVPAIPLKWDFAQLTSGDPWRYLPAHLRTFKIYFVFVGLAFFMPNRISFSIWFFSVAYGFYRMVGLGYLPPFRHGTMADHRTGAMIAMTAGILWIGRAHWAAVFASLFRLPSRSRGEQDRYNRRSGLMFLAGCAGMFGWMKWVGLGTAPACLLVAFAFMIALLISRVVAETGMPFMRLQANATYLAKLAPVKFLSPITLFLAAVVTVLFPVASRVNPAAQATEGLALLGETSPRYRWRFGLALLALLLVGLVIGGAAVVNMKYHHGSTISGQVINGFGSGQLDEANTAMLELSRGELSRPPQNVPAHITFGVALAGLLYWLCLTFPTWPLHPIGLLLIDTPSYGNLVWVSIFVGWLAKVLLVRFGGAAVYRAARSAFLGVIMGEIFAGVFWAAVPVVLAWQDLPFKAVDVLPR